MMKSIFNLIFPKNNKSTFHNTSFYQHDLSNESKASNNSNQIKQAKAVEQEANIFETISSTDSYLVDEISLDEFKSSGRVERRKFPRKPGETRSAYFTKQ